MTQMNHYFYDHQGEIVDQILATDLQVHKGDFIMFTGEQPAIYQIQGVLHIKSESKQPACHNWVVNRMTKLFTNMSTIDTTAPRQPLPLKSVQGYQQK